MTNSSCVLILATGLAGMSGVGAYAQEMAVDAVVIDTIVVDAPKGTGAADAAESIFIGAQDIERRDPQTLNQLFLGEAEVSVGGALPAAQKTYVNGIEETNLAVTVDGARQNRKVFHHSATNMIDPGMIKAVRVDPGVAAADVGPGALGGAIAYETVDADDLLLPGQDVGGFVTGRYESNGNGFTGGIAGYGRSGNADGLAYLRFGTGSDYRNGNGDTVPGTSTDFVSGLIKGAWQSDTGHRFELSAQQVTDDADRPFRANIGSIIGRPEPKVREYDLTSRNVVFSYEATEANGMWQPNALLAWSENVTNVPEPYGSEGEASGWSGKVENLFNLGWIGGIAAGVDFYSEKSSYSDPASSRMTERADNLGIYAQARLNPAERFRLSFGLRGDFQKFEGVSGDTTDTSGLSGNISAEYDLTDAVSVNAGYSNVFGGIALNEPYIYNAAWEYIDLEAARAENYTAGIAFNHRGFTFDAGLFRTEIDNARDASWGGGPFLPVDFQSEGYTLGAGYAWASGFVRASYIDADVTSDGDAVSSDTLTYFGAPIGQVIALEANQSVDRYGLTFGGTVEMTLDNDDLTGQGLETIDGYTVANLYAEYRPAMMERLVLRLEANNLFDETYSDRATYGQEFGSVEPLYERGRSIALNAKLTF